MNFDDALKRYLPRVWFRSKFIKYKYLGRGEPELRLLRHLVAPGSTAIDAGASIGMFAAEMALHAGKVLAFEANPQVAAFTRAVAPRNVEVVNVALSRQAGRATLRMPKNRKGHGVTELATIDRRPAAGADDVIALEVETRRLDDFAIRDCSFIKIDVEGHEEAVLEGAAALIAAQRPTLMIELIEEFNPGATARLSARFATLSYDCYFLSGGRLHPAAAFDPARDQDRSSRDYVANFLFIPAERNARLRALLRQAP
jgi:FkbM family methyltransferase